MGGAAHAAAGLRLWVGFHGAEVTRDTERLLRDTRAGGVIVFQRNIRSADQCRTLLRDLVTAAGRPLIFSVDQEGGLVVRFERDLTVFPGNMALGALALGDPDLAADLARRQGRISGRELRDLGFHVNLAPVLDLATTPKNPGVGLRAFGRDPGIAGALAAALIEGHKESGVHSTAKHFPGIGEARLDTHLDLPSIDLPAAGLEPHLEPFRTAVGAGVGLVMTCHAVFPALDDRAIPATLSEPIVTGLLRRDLGFAGVTTTDDMEMQALTRHFGWEDSVRRAALAGHDVIVVCHTPDRQLQAAAVLRDLYETGTLPEAGLRERTARIEALLDARPARPEAPVADDGATIARRIASGAVAVIRDDARLLPLVPERDGPMAILFPGSAGETSVEDPLRGEDRERLIAALGSLGTAVAVRTYALDPSADDVAETVAFAHGFKTVILAAADMLFGERRRRLASALLRAHPRTVVVLLRSPFDDQVLDPGVPRTAVAGFGFRTCHLEAVAAVLRGAPATGRVP